MEILQFVLSLLGFSASHFDKISSLFGTSESGQAIFNSIFDLILILIQFHQRMK